LHILYLTIEDVVETHADVMTRLGSAVPVLSSRFKLESALERVQNAAYYEEASFAFQAATLGVSIAQAKRFQMETNAPGLRRRLFSFGVTATASMAHGCRLQSSLSSKRMSRW
jgi:hypothetical protein